MNRSMLLEQATRCFASEQKPEFYEEKPAEVANTALAVSAVTEV